MGIYDRDYIDPRFKQPRRRTLFGIRTSSNLMNLIIVNITVFFGLYLFFAIFLMSKNGNHEYADPMFRQQVLRYFVLPSELGAFIKQPWSIITFMFTHFELGFIFSNMLWLWAFGSILEDITGGGKVVATYIYGSLVAGLVFMVINTAFHPLVFGTQLNEYYGASSGIMAIAIAATTLEPDYRLFPNIGRGLPLWIFTLLYVTINIATAPIFFFVVLSAALVGFLMMHYLKKGKDSAQVLNNFFNWFTNLFNPDAKKKKAVRNQLQYQAKTKPFVKTPNVNQQKVDEILDKISKDGGTHNLSKEEKDILRRAGEEL